MKDLPKTFIIEGGLTTSRFSSGEAARRADEVPFGAICDSIGSGGRRVSQSELDYPRIQQMTLPVDWISMRSTKAPPLA